MDGMPLTKEMISTFYDDPNLSEMLEDLVSKGYLTFEYPKKKVGNKRVPDETLEKGYNIVTGKLSFEFTKILSPDDVTPSSRYSFRHSLFDAVHGSFRCRFLPHPMLLYRCTWYIPGLRQCVSAPDIFGAGPLD